MRTFISITVVLLIIVVITQAFIYRSVSKTEQHKYVVLKEYDEFEVRQYAPALFSSVKLNADSYDETASSGFRILAGYIFGGNETNEKIAMTSPVSMEIDDTSKMSFMVPAGYDETNLPKPSNSNIYFEKQDQKIMAAIQFGGWADDEKIEGHKKKLAGLLEKNGIQHSGKFTYLGYDPPYTLVGRRNEVVVELTDFQK
jgi:hypothetical protein